MRLIYSMTVYILCVTSPRVLEGLNQNFGGVIFVGVVLLYLTIKSHNIPLHSTPLLSSALYQQRSFPLLVYIYLLYVSIHTLLEYTYTYTCPLPSSLPPKPLSNLKNPPPLLPPPLSPPLFPPPLLKTHLSPPPLPRAQVQFIRFSRRNRTDSEVISAGGPGVIIEGWILVPPFSFQGARKVR